MIFSNIHIHLSSKNARLAWIGILILSSYSCENFLDVDPPTNEIVSETVFTDDISANAAADGIYSNLMEGNGYASGGTSSITGLVGLSADDYLPYSRNSSIQDIFNNSIIPTNFLVSSLWNSMYETIFFANTMLEGLRNSTDLTANTLNQLEGEGKFMRAFCHFYLVNLYGDIPLVLSTDVETNRLARRTASSEIYEQIISDLLDAQSLLSETYVATNEERIRPNRAAATALLARVYLFLENWSEAEAQASLVLDNPNYALVDDLNALFLANSEEAIWQLRPVVPQENTNDAQTFVRRGSLGAPLTSELFNSFETGDRRQEVWLGSFINGAVTEYYPFKYKIWENGQPLIEYSMVLRLAEQYLIRAESRARLNNISDAQLDLNMIRNRAGLGNTLASDQSSLLQAIEQERRVELFSEWGHRWLDLKRTGRVDTVLGSVKQDWQPTDALYPIPPADLEANPNLTQNPGY